MVQFVAEIIFCCLYTLIGIVTFGFFMKDSSEQETPPSAQSLEEAVSRNLDELARYHTFQRKRLDTNGTKFYKGHVGNTVVNFSVTTEGKVNGEVSFLRNGVHEQVATFSIGNSRNLVSPYNCDYGRLMMRLAQEYSNLDEERPKPVQNRKEMNHSVFSLTDSEQDEHSYHNEYFDSKLTYYEEKKHYLWTLSVHASPGALSVRYNEDGEPVERSGVIHALSKEKISEIEEKVTANVKRLARKRKNPSYDKYLNRTYIGEVGVTTPQKNTRSDQNYDITPYIQSIEELKRTILRKHASYMTNEEHHVFDVLLKKDLLTLIASYNILEEEEKREAFKTAQKGLTLIASRLEEIKRNVDEKRFAKVTRSVRVIEERIK